MCFIHLIWSMASSLFNPCAWQSYSTVSVQVFFLSASTVVLYCYFALGEVWSVVMSICVYLSVCLSACITWKPHGWTSPYFCACYLCPWLSPGVKSTIYDWLTCLCVADGVVAASRQACLSQRRPVSTWARTPVFQVDASVQGFHEIDG